MKRLRFGNHAGFGEQARLFLNTEMFSAEFGLSSDVDLLDYDAIVPFGFDDYRVLERAPELNGVKFIMPSGEVEQLCGDKLSFNLWMSQRGYADLIPRIYSDADIQYPFIVKRRVDEWGIDSHIVVDHASKHLIENYLADDSYFIQQYIVGGFEFALHALVINGVPAYHRLIKYEMGPGLYVKGVNAPARKTEFDDEHDYMMAFNPILKRLGYTGTCCIDFKLQGDWPKILEINPRPGFTLMQDINDYLVAYLACLQPGCDRAVAGSGPLATARRRGTGTVPAGLRVAGAVVNSDRPRGSAGSDEPAGRVDRAAMADFEENFEPDAPERAPMSSPRTTAAAILEPGASEDSASDFVPPGPASDVRRPMLEGLIEIHGFQEAAGCWVFAGWVSRVWMAKPAANVVAVFDMGRLPADGALAFHERDDLGSERIGFLLVVDAPRQPLGRILRLEFRDGDATLDVLPATAIAELADDAIAGRASALLAAVVTPWEHADLTARLARRIVGEGYVELYGYHAPSSGWMVSGWLSQNWISRAEQPIEAMARFERGTEAGPALFACFERADVHGKGLGVVVHVAAPDHGLGRLLSLTLRAGETVVVAKSAASSARLTGKGVGNRMLILLADAETNPAVETLRGLASRPMFDGRDTVASLADPVPITIDETIVCDADSVVLIGWLLERPGVIKAIRLRCGEDAFPVAMDGLRHRVNRKDVIDGPGRAHGFDDPRCGFVVRVPTGRRIAGTMHLEIETAAGEVGFKALPPPRLDGLAAMKCLLGCFQTEYADVDAIYDKILGPAIGALNARRLSSAPLSRSFAFGESATPPRHSVIVPLHGRIDFMEVQMALFATVGLGRDVEILYVLDDPPRTREAQFLAASIYERFRIPFRLICLEQNVGFAPANNVGLRAASGGFVCFLNSDVFPITSDWLDRLAADLEADAGLGAVGPLLEFEDGSVQHQGIFFRTLSQYGGWAFPHHTRKGFRPPTDGGLSRVAAITGACMLLRRETAEAYGGFDEAFIIGDFEDTDLCLKLARDGLAVAVDAGVRLHHLERKSQASSAQAWRQSLTLYNAWMHQRRWGERLEAMVGADDRR